MIKYDGAVFDTVEELIEYKRLIEGKVKEKVVVVQERKPDFDRMREELQRTDGGRFIPRRQIPKVLTRKSIKNNKELRKLRTERIKEILTTEPNKYNLSELTEKVCGVKSGASLATMIKALAKRLKLIKAIRLYQKPAKVRKSRKFLSDEHLKARVKELLKQPSNLQHLSMQIYGNNYNNNRTRISKVVKELGLMEMIGRKKIYKAHTMSNRKPSSYQEFIEKRIKEIMIAQKVDYVTAYKLAIAEWKPFKQHRTIVQQPQMPVHPFPQICQSDGMLRLVVRDLIRKNIDSINIDYADNISVRENEWLNFLATFMVNSSKIAAHFEIADKFVVENNRIYYKG